MHAKNLKLEAKKKDNEYKELSKGFELLQRKREVKKWQQHKRVRDTIVKNTEKYAM